MFMAKMGGGKLSLLRPSNIITRRLTIFPQVNKKEVIISSRYCPLAIDLVPWR